jgi:hypothetical protein
MRKHKKILFLTGSMNQTSQMQQIAGELPDYDCWFSQVFTDAPLLRFMVDKTSLLNRTIISRPYKTKAETHLSNAGLNIDYRALQGAYELVVFCSDLVVPERLRNTKTIWVQEGMIDKYTRLSSIVQKLRLPPHWCFNTSLNGSTNTCDLYCAASPGYQEYISGLGTEASRIYVTGIPNYDNLRQFENNSFPYHDYVMIATTDMRETARMENRPAFIRECAAIADGRPMLFKLHPNEKLVRAEKEILKYGPKGSLILQQGNTNEMIANCEELITQYSTVAYTGLALGKKVHSWFDVAKLKRLLPVQNGGTSARNIAHICRNYIEFDGTGKEFTRHFRYRPVSEWQSAGNPVQEYNH